MYSNMRQIKVVFNDGLISDFESFDKLFQSTINLSSIIEIDCSNLKLKEKD